MVILSVCLADTVIVIVSTPGLSRGGFTLKGGIDSVKELVERLLRAHTNLVLRESLDVALHHLLPWDIELVIDDPEPEPEVCEKV